MPAEPPRPSSPLRTTLPVRCPALCASPVRLTDSLVLVAWEWTLGTFLGHGRGACYRGDQLFDTPAVQAMVTKWTSFWLRYRPILIQDIVHVKRPDMQSIDSVMHVTSNRSATLCALAMFYNPSLFAQQATLSLPMYYTGEGAEVWLEPMGNGSVSRRALARDYSVRVNVTLGPREIGYTVVHRGSRDPPPGLREATSHVALKSDDSVEGQAVPEAAVQAFIVLWSQMRLMRLLITVGLEAGSLEPDGSAVGALHCVTTARREPNWAICFGCSLVAALNPTPLAFLVATTATLYRTWQLLPSGVE